MATKKTTGSIKQGYAGQQEEEPKNFDNGAHTRQKVDELVEIVRGLVDSKGYFDPKEVHERTRNTDLAKSASIIMSNLRLQGFGKDDKLRVPISDRPDAIKKLINLASRLRKKGIMIPFEEAVATILSESPEMTDFPEAETAIQPEPKPETKPEVRAAPAPVKPVAQQSDPQAPAPKEPDSDFRALYEASKDKALKLEAELEAYKQMCFRLIDALRH